MSYIQCQFQLKSVHKFKYSMPIAMSFGLVYFRKRSLRILSRYLFTFPLSPTSSSSWPDATRRMPWSQWGSKGTHSRPALTKCANHLWNCPDNIYFPKRSFFNLYSTFSSKLLVSGRYKIIVYRHFKLSHSNPNIFLTLLVMGLKSILFLPSCSQEWPN